MKERVLTFLSLSGVALLKVLVIIAIGVLVIKSILKVISKIFVKAKIEKSVRKFLFNLIKYLLYLVLVMIVLDSLGVSTTGFIAALSALGLAISLALQSSLSNLANGIVLLVIKPFKEGDSIVVGNFSGLVKEIKMMHTVLTSFDNKEISIPNKMVIDNAILNATALEQRKLTYNFLVSYKSDVDKVKSIIFDTFNSTNLILTEPKSFVGIESLEPNGIKFIASCYVESRNYFKVYYPVLEEIFNEFKRNNIVLPYAQLDVTLKDDKASNLPVRAVRELPQQTETNDTPKVKKGKNIFKYNDDLDNESYKSDIKQTHKDDKGESADNMIEDENTDYLKYVNEINIVEEVITDNEKQEPNKFTNDAKLLKTPKSSQKSKEHLSKNKKQKKVIIKKR